MPKSITKAARNNPDILRRILTEYKNGKATDWTGAFSEHPEWAKALGVTQARWRTDQIRLYGAINSMRKHGILPPKNFKSPRYTIPATNAPVSALAAPKPASSAGGSPLHFCPHCGQDLQSLLVALNAMAQLPPRV